MVNGDDRMSEHLFFYRQTFFGKLRFWLANQPFAVLLLVLSDAIRLHVRLKERNRSVIGCDDNTEQTVFTL